jgi:hypothetical protein
LAATNLRDAGVAREKCAFCGADGPLTNEHVWPKRFEKCLVAPPGPRRYRHEMTGESADKPDREWMTVSFDHQVRIVCRDCNHGWMANLDAEAEPLVCALMGGRTIYLQPEAQDLLARWALKTAYVCEYLNAPELRFVPAEHRDELRRGILPGDTYVYVSCYRGVHAGWHRRRSFDLYENEARVEGKGYILSFGLGELAVQVVGYPDIARRPIEVQPEGLAWERRLLPRFANSISLPPPRCITDDLVETYATMLP